MYPKEHPETFFSAPSTKEYEILTKCHPEFLLNEMYRNEHTPFYATCSDLVYTIVRAYLGNQVGCTEANNIIKKVGGSAGFEILIRAAQERNKRNSKRQSKKMKTGTHQFQVAAKTVLDEWGVDVPKGENVLSIYKSIKRPQRQFLMSGVWMSPKESVQRVSTSPKGRKTCWIMANM